MLSIQGPGTYSTDSISSSSVISSSCSDSMSWKGPVKPRLSLIVSSWCSRESIPLLGEIGRTVDEHNSDSVRRTASSISSCNVDESGRSALSASPTFGTAASRTSASSCAMSPDDATPSSKRANGPSILVVCWRFRLLSNSSVGASLFSSGAAPASVSSADSGPVLSSPSIGVGVGRFSSSTSMAASTALLFPLSASVGAVAAASTP
mmetsp:Transcript_905/g.2089  ORF Transcript_905/g.2089 Transcript_905/m.2089 type:complete len:207 (-) Transcript_905:1246-1866(-)